MSSDLARRVKAVRRLIKPRDRTAIFGAITYRCTCGMSQEIALAKGVDRPGEWRLGVPAPSRMDCSFCDGEAVYVAGSYRDLVGGRAPGQSYLRIPSRRAMTKIGIFEAQLVEPETSIDVSYKAPNE